MANETELGPADTAAYLEAMNMAALNGMISLLLVMAQRGLVTEQEVSAMHDAVRKPLAAGAVAGSQLVQDAQQNLDLLFAEVKRFLRDGPGSPDEERGPPQDR